MKTPSHSRDGKPATLRPDKARAAAKAGAIRYVLALSLAGAIIATFLAWLYFGW